MYRDYFGLRDKPFALTPNTDFLVQLPPYQACLNLLRVALDEGEGFVKVTGEVGTGKTLLCRALLNELNDAQFQVAYLPNPMLTPQALHFALAHELGLVLAHGLSEHAVLTAINLHLIEIAATGRSTLLLIDEAQAFPPETLEALRLLTNLETEQAKLLQVVLFGQPELDRLLECPAFRQLRQRITFSYRLYPLSIPDVSRYLQERLSVAGYEGEPLFDSGAIRTIARGSGGIPRLLNILANKSLMVVFGEGRRCVSARHVRRAIADTEGARPFLRRPPALLRWGVAAGVLSAGVLIGLWAWSPVQAWLS
jgi:MSHA biogenesis protein MshM